MISRRRLVWLAALVIVPISALLAIYGVSGYVMTASMSVATNWAPDEAAAQGRIWLAVIAASVTIFVGGVVVLFRFRGGA